MDSHGDVAEKIYNMYVNYNLYIYNIELCPSYLHISPCPVPPPCRCWGHESHGLFGCRQCRQVDNIVTEPNATSTKFLLYGTRGDTVPCCGDTVPKPAGCEPFFSDEGCIQHCKKMVRIGELNETCRN